MLQSWHELTTRYRKAANDCNHAAAFLGAAKVTEPGKSIKNIDRFKPYADPGNSGILSPDIQRLIHKLRESGEIPARMMADLYHHGLLEQ